MSGFYINQNCFWLSHALSLQNSKSRNNSATIQYEIVENQNGKVPGESFHQNEMRFVNEEMLSEVGIMANREYEDSPDSFIQISQASGMRFYFWKILKF